MVWSVPGFCLGRTGPRLDQHGEWPDIRRHLNPGALMQPPHIRTPRARALAAELKTAMQHVQDIHVSLSRLPIWDHEVTSSQSSLEPMPTVDRPQDHYGASKRQVLGLDYHGIARLSDRFTGLACLRSSIGASPRGSHRGPHFVKNASMPPEIRSKNTTGASP